MSKSLSHVQSKTSTWKKTRDRKTNDSKAESGPLPSLYLFSITPDFPGLSPGMRRGH